MLQGILSFFGLTSVNPGDFVYHLSQGAYSVRDFLPDVTEPVVMPVLDAMAEYPITTCALTAISGGALLWSYMKNNDYAIASGHKMNCSLHGIMHTWLAQKEATIRAQINQYPIFQELVRSCLERYGLPTEDSVNTFLDLMERFNHPRDREIILGPVLRNMLQDNVPLNEIHEVIDDEEIPDDLLHHLTTQMGAKLVIHNTTEFRSVQQSVEYLPQEGHYTWEVHLYHVGGHYNFKLHTNGQCRAHNQKMNNPDSAQLFELRHDYDRIQDTISIERSSLLRTL